MTGWTGLAEEDGPAMLNEGLNRGRSRARLYALLTFINRNTVTSR